MRKVNVSALYNTKQGAHKSLIEGGYLETRSTGSHGILSASSRRDTSVSDGEREPTESLLRESGNPGVAPCRGVVYAAMVRRATVWVGCACFAGAPGVGRVS